MPKNRLNIIDFETDKNDLSVKQPLMSSSKARIKEMQAKFERLWLIDPERFNSMRNCLQRERLERTWQLLRKHENLDGKKTADIGCAAGVFSRRLRDAGCKVEAIDIAENALKLFAESDAERIVLKQDAMPTTRLLDHTYDIIICTELIAELPHEDHRLFFAELARLIKINGKLICSSDIDIDSIGGKEKLLELAQTEFDILEDVASYHALYLRLKHFFESPSHFIKGWQNQDFKRKEMASRHGLNKWWYWLNTTPLLIPWWYVCQQCLYPIQKILRNNHWLLLKLEKICRFFWDKDGISHYLFIATRRPLKPIKPQEIPIEKPKKKEIWD